MKSLIKALRYLISGFWYGLSVCRVIVGNLIFLALLILLVSIFFYEGERIFLMKRHLFCHCKAIFVIKKTETISSSRFVGRGERQETLLKDVIDVIDCAKDDQRVKALVLKLNDMGICLAPLKLADIGEALNRFKSSGKPIYASGDYHSQNQYHWPPMPII